MYSYLDKAMAASFSGPPSHRAIYCFLASLVLLSWVWTYGWSYSLGGLGFSDSGSPSPSSPGPAHNNSGIYNSTLGFQKIIVISLPDRSDRRDGIALGAALSGIEFEFMDSVRGQEIPDKVLSLTNPNREGREGEIGCWRGHMNAMRYIVQNNITSALILEDDVDWDVYLRDQLNDFARATRALTQPLDPLPPAGKPQYADPTFPKPLGAAPPKAPELPFASLPATAPPASSPYGDNWDLLWLGHCVMQFAGNAEHPQGRVVWSDTRTVPAQRHLVNYMYAPGQVDYGYGDHARIVHHAQAGACTFGYGVTQRSARQLLYEIGLKPIDMPVDLALRAFCEGTFGRAYHRCLTTTPPLFNSHRAFGQNIKGGSDNSQPEGEGLREKAETDNVRWSVRLNAEELINGGSKLVDQFPDETK